MRFEKPKESNKTILNDNSAIKTQEKIVVWSQSVKNNMMESLPGLKNKKIEKRPSSLWNICNKMGEWFNFAALGMDGIGIKSDR